MRRGVLLCRLDLSSVCTVGAPEDFSSRRKRVIEAVEIGIVVGIETFATILDHEHVEYSTEFIESRTLSRADFHYLFWYMEWVP
jgi:hypothetical protein